MPGTELAYLSTRSVSSSDIAYADAHARCTALRYPTTQCYVLTEAMLLRAFFVLIHAMLLRQCLLTYAASVPSVRSWDEERGACTGTILPDFQQKTRPIQHEVHPVQYKSTHFRAKCAEELG
eukprot:254280-Rhodomonas_salina.2